jgi:hypothetical protein
MLPAAFVTWATASDAPIIFRYSCVLSPLAFGLMVA